MAHRTATIGDVASDVRCCWRWNSPFATASPGSFTKYLRIATFYSRVSGSEHLRR